MSENYSHHQSEEPERHDPQAPPASEDAEVLPFPTRSGTTKHDVDDGEALPPDEVKPGEWQAELPDQDAEDQDEDLNEGQAVDPPAAAYPASLAETMRAKDKARRPVLPSG